MTKRDKKIQLTFTEKEKADVKRISTHNGMQMAAFIRHLALSEVRRVDSLMSEQSRALGGAA